MSTVVVAGNGPARKWLKHIRLNWKELSSAAVHHSTVESIQDRYASVFGEDLGFIKLFKANLQVKPNTQPKFYKPRPEPFAIKDAIGKELDRLEAKGIIEKVNHIRAAPIVPVPKSFAYVGTSALQVDHYPLPKPEDLFATLVGGQKFTNLDLSQAYLQLGLDDKSMEYTTISTHKGMYRFTRLPFGIASAPAVFQQTMVQGIPKAV